MLLIKDLLSGYKKRKNVLKNINLKFTNASFISIIGESGSGKTTLLKCISKQLKYKGSILLDNKDIQSFNKNENNYYKNKFISFLTQDFSLVDELNVKENIALPFSLRKEILSEEKILKVFSALNLDKEYLYKKVDELSQGEKQRVALARVVLNDSQIILCDEPTGNLDSKNSLEIYKILKELSKEKLIIVVSHNDYLTEKFSDRIIRLNKGEIIEDKLLNELKNEDKKVFKISESMTPFFNTSIFKIFTKFMFNKIPLSLILIFLSSLCCGFISSFIDIRMFNEPIRTQEIINSSKISAIEPDGLESYDEESSSTTAAGILESDYSSFASYCRENQIPYIPLFTNNTISSVFTGFNPYNPSFNHDLTFSMIDESLSNSFNLKILGNLPKENEILLSSDNLFKLGIAEKNIDYTQKFFIDLIDDGLFTYFQDRNGAEHQYRVSGFIMNPYLQISNYTGYFTFQNTLFFDSDTFNEFTSFDDNLKITTMLFSGLNNGYLKALNYKNSRGFSFVFSSEIVNLAQSKKVIITALSIFSIMIIVFLLIVNLIVFFNYLYSQKINSQTSIEILINNGASKHFINTGFAYILILTFLISALLTFIFNLISNSIINLISYVSNQPTDYPIAYFEPITILIVICFFIVLFLIGRMYFSLNKVKQK